VIGWTQAQCRPIVYARAGLGDPNHARCERCGRASPLTMDHLKNRSQGGTWAPSNIVILCGSGTTGCHGWKTEWPDAAHDAHWALKRGEEPGVTPIFHHPSQAWVRLDDDGMLIPV